MNKTAGAVFAAGFIFCAATAVYGAAIDHGTEGVADTSKVRSLLQLTTNEAAGNNILVGGDWPLSELGMGDIQPWKLDNQWVVFSSEVDGTSYWSDREVAKIKIDGTSYTRLTNNVVDDSNGSFSSDDRIYYQGYDTVNSRYDIFRKNADGSGLLNLSDAHGASQSEVWPVISPDGAKVAYLSYDGTGYKLFVANTDGTSPVVVSGDDIVGPILLSEYSGAYSWSPDSQWLAYAGRPPAQSNRERIFKVRADGTDNTQLTPVSSDLVYHYLPVWSPDGNIIAYYYSDSSNRQLRTISSSDGTALQTVDSTDSATADGWDYLYPPFSWSPDSQWVAYSKRYDFSVGTDYNALFIARVDGSQSPAQLTGSYNDFAPFWNPGGDKILFQTRQGQGSYASRDSSCSPNCESQIMLLNLTDNYGGSGSSSSFPWPMFLPSIVNNAR
ncbi:MAG: hypothetical protein V2I36_15790 [Desulfopila sp.]|jgi:Tol biopolymer transport system component|nr:hypothetical protein [Desulfopila sp.]